MSSFSVYAPYRGMTGYDNFVRLLLKEWHHQGHQIALTEFERWSNTRGSTDIDPILREMEENNNRIDPEFHINFCLLDQVRLNPNTPNVIYTMFEADRICPNWIESAKQLDAIIVPTEFNRQTFVASGVPADKVIVCPVPLDVDNICSGRSLGLQAKAFNGEDLMKYKHRFLNVSEYITRKNVEGLIQAWCDETKPEDDACLILKLNSNLFAKTDFFGGKLQSIIKNRKCAPIFFFNDFVSDAEMLELYKLCTHYITASCGEGWGISESTCGLLGKRLIAPNSSAFLDYWDWEDAGGAKKCTNGYPVIVQASGARQTGPTEFYYQNARWWIPIQYDIRKKIKLSIKEANEGENTKGQLLSNKLKGMCESVKVSNKLLNQIRKISPRKFCDPSVVTEDAKFGLMTICKSLDTKCGIADYTKMLYDGTLTEENKKLFGGHAMMKGEALQYRSTIDKYNVHVVNLQLEYQFISPKRLKILIEYLKNSKIIPVVTLHTVNPRAYDYHKILSESNCNIIVSSEVMKSTLISFCGIKENKIFVLPMGINNTFVTEPKARPNNTNFRLGFFGFAYPHKGLDKIIQYMNLNQEGKEAVIISTKPENDQGYFDSVVRMFKRKPLKAQWVTDYLEEGQIVQGLSTCDLIFLPYSEYGGYGVSAAVRTALKAGVPIATFENSFFKDVVNDYGLVKFVGSDPHDYDSWSAELDKYINEIRGNELYKMQYLNKRNKFIQDCNWEAVGATYLKHLKTLVENK